MLNDDVQLMAVDCINLAITEMCTEIKNTYCSPSAVYKPAVYPDGDKWCALYGINIQEGICGFGDTPLKAVEDFNKNWYWSKTHNIKGEE